MGKNKSYMCINESDIMLKLLYHTYFFNELRLHSLVSLSDTIELSFHAMSSWQEKFEDDQNP